VKNTLYEYSVYEHPLDSLLIGDKWDDWDHVRYLISEHLRGLERLGDRYIDINDLPFFMYFEGKMKEKLIKVGFEKDAVDNPDELELILKELDKQAREYAYPVWLNLPYGYPSGSFTVSPDNRIMWVNPDIDAALRTLESIKIMKGLLTNKEALRIYLRAFELTVNLSRAGTVPELVSAEVKRIENSRRKRELKQRIIRTAIRNIFQKKPTTLKTLGDVWNKFDAANKNTVFENPKIEKGIFRVKTGKNSKGKDSVIITKDGKYYSNYAKRSLQLFINELK